MAIEVGPNQVRLQVTTPEAEHEHEQLVIGPPESIGPSSIFKLYRGTTGEVDVGRLGGRGGACRVWVEFPALQLCWAGYDLPATIKDSVSLLDLSGCQIETVQSEDCELCRVSVHSQSGRTEGTMARSNESDRLAVSVLGVAEGALPEFGEALRQLLCSRDTEGSRGLEFIQKRLFQYLWTHQSGSKSDGELYEAQAVLAFNLDPKEGVAYLKSKLNKRTDAEIGEWLAQMSQQKGGLDPTLLGSYFSRRDTLEVFRTFVSCIDFSDSDIILALRRLFDTFKPGGEGQVITRILEYFAEAYFQQWRGCQASVFPQVAYADSDQVMQVAVSLIMLNTGIHVAPKKVGKKKAMITAMTMDEYIASARRCVAAECVPEEAMRTWYEAVQAEEISVEPLPRTAFSKLPVQPDIEGWLLAVLSAQRVHRYWAVLALQRMYLFSDSSEVEPADAVDLKDTVVRCVSDDAGTRERYFSDLRRRNRGVPCCMRTSQCGDLQSDLLNSEECAFEVCQQQGVQIGRPAIIPKLDPQPRTRLALVAESADLMEKWVSLISSGPY